MTKDVQKWWNTGKITEIGEFAPPTQPSRIDSLTVVEPGRIKRGKGGTQACSRTHTHTQKHTEESK